MTEKIVLHPGRERCRDRADMLGSGTTREPVYAAGASGYAAPMTQLKVSSKNALFQQLLALRENRQKRHRLGLFLVEGTSAIDAAVQHGWEIQDLLYPAQRRLSDWARAHLASGVAQRHVEVDAALLAELTDRHEGTELLAVARRRDTSIEQLVLPEPWLVVALDRPKSPGNVGSIIRTAVSFDAAALVITGHAADPFDPACVRASVGTLFALPLVQLQGHEQLLAWADQQRARSTLCVLGSGQHGPDALSQVDLTGNLLLILGNETSGISRSYAERCDRFVHLPTSARQSSLNVCAAAAILLYEVQRQRQLRGLPAPAAISAAAASAASEAATSA
jgi:TrmH family RNA methyltransferase